MGNLRGVEVLSIGYAGRNLPEFASLLRQYGVTHVVDVRTSPFSKFAREFDRPSLEAALPERGIRYVYLGEELGGRPDCPDCYDAEGRVMYERVQAQPFFQRGIKQLVKGAAVPGRMLCLMCSERKPESCHRSKLVGEALVGQGVAVRHISEDGALVEQSAVMQRLNDGQLDLFGDARESSRKNYRKPA